MAGATEEAMEMIRERVRREEGDFLRGVGSSAEDARPLGVVADPVDDLSEPA
jgi:hypothetical protein